MREIKFRAWNKETKQMISWNSMLELRNLHKLLTLNFVEVMQYTGLKDKNGKEIYEGDIVKCFDHPTGTDSATGEVFYSQGTWKVKDTICPLADFGTAWTEVIGNIYETPTP